MSGLEQETSYGTHLCNFKLRVVFQGDEKRYNSFKLLGVTTDSAINKPANAIKLQSTCVSGSECVFKVTETDVNNWTGLQLGGSWRLNCID